MLANKAEILIPVYGIKMIHFRMQQKFDKAINSINAKPRVKNLIFIRFKSSVFQLNGKRVLWNLDRMHACFLGYLFLFDLAWNKKKIIFLNCSIDLRNHIFCSRIGSAQKKLFVI